MYKLLDLSQVCVLVSVSYLRARLTKARDASYSAPSWPYRTSGDTDENGSESPQGEVLHVLRPQEFGMHFIVVKAVVNTQCFTFPQI